MADTMGNRGPQSSQTTQTQGSGVQKVEQKAHQATERVAEKAQASVENAQSRIAQQLSAVARAIDSAANRLQQDQQSGLSQRVKQYVQKVENISQQVREKSPRELKDDVHRIARQQPAWFLGGAFLLGLLGARFLKSSASDQEGAVEYGRA
jgi:uncharacterized protein YukE